MHLDLERWTLTLVKCDRIGTGIKGDPCRYWAIQ